MIAAVKHSGKIDKEKILHEIAFIKQQFGIREHYLEKLAFQTKT